MYEKYGGQDFTVVGLALDAEGIAPAKLYYEQFGVTFPSLVDPDYATRFGAVPKTFFVDERGVVLDARNWERQLATLGDTKPVADSVRQQWSAAESRLDSAAMARLAEAHAAKPNDLAVATQLASRYLALGLNAEAAAVLQRAIQTYDVKQTALAGGDTARLLSQAYHQLMRSRRDDRERQVRDATTAYYLDPTIGFAKQIARLIDPAKFDHRPNGRLDNTFREATYQRLKRERAEWLAE